MVRVWGASATRGCCAVSRTRSRGSGDRGEGGEAPSKRGEVERLELRLGELVRGKRHQRLCRYGASASGRGGALKRRGGNAWRGTTRGLADLSYRRGEGRPRGGARRGWQRRGVRDGINEEEDDGRESLLG